MKLINTALIPNDYNPQDYLKQIKDTAMIPIDTTVYNNATISSFDEECTKRMNVMESSIQSLALKIYVLEGRLSREEADNLLNMLSSEDEASKTLAGEIINKFKGNEYSIQ